MGDYLRRQGLPPTLHVEHRDPTNGRSNGDTRWAAGARSAWKDDLRERRRGTGEGGRIATQRTSSAIHHSILLARAPVWKCGAGQPVSLIFFFSRLPSQHPGRISLPWRLGPARRASTLTGRWENDGAGPRPHTGILRRGGIEGSTLPPPRHAQRRNSFNFSPAWARAPSRIEGLFTLAGPR